MSKSLMTRFSEDYDQWRTERRDRQSMQPQPMVANSRLRSWLPTKGNVLFVAALHCLLVPVAA